MSGSVPLSGKATVDALGDQWAKMLAIIMLKHNITDVTITAKDVMALGGDDKIDYCLVPGPGASPEEIRIRLMKTPDAIAEAKKHKSGFGMS